MKEVIARLKSDHVKVKGAEYVQDLVRCKDCDNICIDRNGYWCSWWDKDIDLQDFCSYGEVRDEQ